MNRGRLGSGAIIAWMLCGLLLTALPALTASPTWAGEVELAFENPWMDTHGGTRPVGTDTPQDPWDPWEMAPWQLWALRNETRQAFVTLTNTGEAPRRVTVSIDTDFGDEPGDAELLAPGTIASKHHGTPLVNLFTAEQLASFEGDFPDSIGNVEVIRDFPTLYLPPGEPTRLWLRVHTMDLDAERGAQAYTPRGQYTLTFRAEGDGIDLEQPIGLTVLTTSMPAEPLIETGTWDRRSFSDLGPEGERHAKRYHITIWEGHRNYFMTRLSLPGSRADQVELSQRDPEAFQQRVNEAVDESVRQMREQGFRESQILLNAGDEVTDASADHRVAVYRAVRRYRPDIKIFSNPHPVWTEAGRPVTLDGTFKPLAPYVDVWAPHSTHYHNPAIAQFLEQTGAQRWHYNNMAPQTARNEPAVLHSYRRMGWLAIKHDLDGMTFWTAMRPEGDPWDDTDPRRPDASVVFESEAGLITTRAWEAWRETVEDVNIYRMIERAVETGDLDADLERRAKMWLRNSPMWALGVDAGPRYRDWRGVYQARLRAYHLLEAIVRHEGVDALLDGPQW